MASIEIMCQSLSFSRSHIVSQSSFRTRKHERNNLKSKLQIFSSYFLDGLVRDGYDGVKLWTTHRKKINIFLLKSLIIPYHSANHWSLFVIVNLDKFKIDGRPDESSTAKKPWQVDCHIFLSIVSEINLTLFHIF